MTQIWKPRQLAVNGVGIGRWRVIITSDENDMFVEACDCENGHATPDEAKHCPKVGWDIAFPQAPKDNTYLVARLQALIGVLSERVDKFAAERDEARALVRGLLKFPSLAHAYGGVLVWCNHCGNDFSRGQRINDPANHAPDCPWRLAAEAVQEWEASK